MTRQTFHQDLNDLKQGVLRMGALVEQALLKATRSLSEQDLKRAAQVIEGDKAINAMEAELEERCLALLALQQPMASDLRLLGCTLKIVTDLERIGDHAADVAKVARRSIGHPHLKPLVDIPRMCELTRTMLQEALSAYLTGNAELAARMVQRDHEVDALYKGIVIELLTYMAHDPSTVQRAAYLLMAAQHLERAADHATNLGEWTVYLVTGYRPQLNN